jgi:hypothetical protein
MSNVPISKLPSETLQQLEAQCTDVVAEICRSLSYNSDLVDAIRSLMHEKDTAAAIYALRESYPDLANRILMAALGVLVNAVNLTSIQDEMERRIRESNCWLPTSAWGHRLFHRRCLRSFSEKLCTR